MSEMMLGNVLSPGAFMAQHCGYSPRTLAQPREDAGVQNVGDGAGDPGWVAVAGMSAASVSIRPRRRSAIGSRQQKNASVRTDASTLEQGGNFLLADAWEHEGQKRIVGVSVGKSGRGVRVGVTQSLNDTRWL
jgi:hypothetical protein